MSSQLTGRAAVLAALARPFIAQGVDPVHFGRAANRLYVGDTQPTRSKDGAKLVTVSVSLSELSDELVFERIAADLS